MSEFVHEPVEMNENDAMTVKLAFTLPIVLHVCVSMDPKELQGFTWNTINPTALKTIIDNYNNSLEESRRTRHSAKKTDGQYMPDNTTMPVDLDLLKKALPRFKSYLRTTSKGQFSGDFGRRRVINNQRECSHHQTAGTAPSPASVHASSPPARTSRVGRASWLISSQHASTS